MQYLKNQDYPRDRLEIIVVDGDSSDETVTVVNQAVAKDDRIKLLSNPRRLSSAARNIGAKNATGEIITFIDGHTYIAGDQLLKYVARLMEEKEVSVLSRPQFLETPDNNHFQQAVATARRSFVGHGLESTIYTDMEDYVDPTSSGASYRRGVFDKTGYFDERFDACEDLEFNYRVNKAGFKAFISPKLSIFYYPRSSIRTLFYQMKRYGIGRMRMARKHPGSFSLGTIIPALFAAGIVILPVLSLLWKFPLSVYLLLYGIYALLIIMVSVYLAIKGKFSFLPNLLVIFPIIHLGLGWGFLTEFWRTLIGRGYKRREGD